MRKTYNQGNWSGKEITVNINQKKRTFSLFGYDFQITKKNHGEGFVTYELLGNEWSYPLATCSMYVGDEFTKDDTYIFATEGDYSSRDSKDMYEAAVQLLCNII